MAEHLKVAKPIAKRRMEWWEAQVRGEGDERELNRKLGR